MTITFRNDDPVSGRWTGIGADLSAFQIDSNFYELLSRITTLESNTKLTVSISYITISGNDLTFHMTDHTTQGPFTIPPSTFHGRGTWQPDTPYNVNDTFDINGSLYLVIFAHTSAATFDPNANDGLGHNYYSLMITVPGSALPGGGAAGQALVKTSSTAYATGWGGWTVPAGGTAGQNLKKIDSTDGNTHWVTDLLALLNDVIIVSPLNNGDVLTWDGSNWRNHTSSGGGGSIASASDVSFSGGAPFNGSLLFYNGSKWDGTPQPAHPLQTLFWDGSTWRPSTNSTLGTSGTVTINPTVGENVFTITPTADVTLEMSSAPALGEFTLIVLTSGTTSRNITFDSSWFRAQGDLATGTVDGKYFILQFIVHPTSGFVLEKSRTIAL